MLWRTSPAATELEEVTLGVAPPADRSARRRSKASSTTPRPISTLHALAAAREVVVAGRARRGTRGPHRISPAFRVYCSRARALVDRQGGHPARPRTRRGAPHVPADAEFRMRADALADAIARDRAAGVMPLAVVATVGTTSTTSVDPVEAIADICRSRADLAARRRRLRRRGRDGARLRVDPARRRARRLPRRQSRTSGCSRRSISACSTAAAWTRCARRSH